MARTQRDEVQDQVRTQLQEALVSAGVNAGRVALEVLFWLPQEFVREYQDLFMRGLHLGDRDDGEKAGSDQGRVKAKVKGSARGTSKGMEAGGGKRYKTEWVVKDERALAVKAKVDRKLVELLRRSTAELRKEEKEGQGKVLGSTPGVGESHGSGAGESHGSTPGVGELVELVAGGKKKRCRDCGRIAASDWARCPYPHA